MSSNGYCKTRLYIGDGQGGPYIALEDADGRGGYRIAGPKPNPAGSIGKTLRVHECDAFTIVKAFLGDLDAEEMKEVRKQLGRLIKTKKEVPE